MLPETEDKRTQSASPSLRNDSSCNGAQSPMHILRLPNELIYGIFDHLPAEDVVTFSCCRWDFFRGVIDLLEKTVGSPLQGLQLFVEMFERENWPRTRLCEVVRMSSHYESPILHTCISYRLEEVACRFLQYDPRRLFDTGRLLMSTLHLSVMHGGTDVLREIQVILSDLPEPDRLDYVNRRNELRSSALEYAIQADRKVRNKSIVDILIDLGADIDQRDRVGCTPLMDACYYGWDEVINCLLDHGANTTLVDSFTLSVLEYIMIGDCQSKSSYLRRLASSATERQLNRALRHSFNNRTEFLGVLMDCGADPDYVGRDAHITIERLRSVETERLDDSEDAITNSTSGVNSSQIAEQLGNVDDLTVDHSIAAPDNKKGRQSTVDSENCSSSHTVKINLRNDKTTNSLLSHSKPKTARTYPDNDVDTPCRYDDFQSDDTSEDMNSLSHCLGRGKTLMEAARGNRTLYLNSYGPRSSAVIIWESVPAVSQSANVANLHRNALQRMLKEYNESIPSLREKVDKMIAVAWQPKGEIPQIQNLPILAEELNPENKTKISNFRFTFTTVLVKWREEFHWLSPRWLSRSEYKRLAGTRKKISEKADHEIYRTACLQLKRFKDGTNRVQKARDAGV